MQMYSEFSRVRVFQIVTDVLAVLVVVISIWTGVVVAGFVAAFARLGHDIQGVGDGFQGAMSDAARTLGAIPLLGQGVASPFVSASEAGATLEAAGRDQQTAVGNAAVLLGVAIALVPILVVGWVWFRRRLRFVRAARDVRQLVACVGGPDLLALRALARADPSTLLKLAGGPENLVLGWRQGDPVVLRTLAAAELSRAGIQPGAFFT